MSDPTESLSFAAEFPAASREQWLALVTAGLKGADYDKRMVARSADGLRIDALYDRAADARPIAGRPLQAPWQVMQRVEHPDAAAANTEALHDLENGASGLMLVFAGAPGAHGYGLAPTADAIARALDGVYLDAGIGVELDLGPAASTAPTLLAACIAARGVAPASTRIRFGLDPLGALATTGDAPAWDEAAPRLAADIAALQALGFAGPFTVADGRPVHAAGGSEAQELAFVLANAIAYLRAMEAGGIDLDAARRAISFRLAADADQFLTVAKFRAVRKLWARIEEACGLTPEPVFVSAETAWRMMTRRDPWVNILRTTLASFAAGIAGANAVTALPFTAALGLPDRLARRIARNMQLILLEESNLAKVADPAAGAGGIEALTSDLCDAAWGLLQEIEAAGGADAALRRGLIQQKVAASRATRQKAVATRRDALTGTSEFPHLAERPVSVLDVPPVASMESEAKGQVLRPMRLAAPFERLRDASDRLLAETGARPKLFLAVLGTPADFTARASFAKNLFEAGGIETVETQPLAGADGTTDLAALAAAFSESGARAACLCSSDAIYGREAVAAARALTTAGAKPLYLAGRPGDDEAALRAAGVETFVFAGGDVLATLNDAHARLAGTPPPQSGR